MPTLPRLTNGDGDAGVPFYAPISLHNNTTHSVVSPDTAAYVSSALQGNHGMARGPLLNDYAMDRNFWESWQIPNLYKDSAISAPPSTVTRSEIVVSDLHSSSSIFVPSYYPINQVIGHMGPGQAVNPAQWPVIEEDDSELGL